MEIVYLTPGTPEWLAHRAQHLNASDAPAMMSASPYKSRADLVREIATTLSKEVSNFVQERIFDPGHRFEALARPLAESIIGDDLSPLVGVLGKYSASFDGITADGDIAFEHKKLNDRLRAVMQGGCSGADLPEDYRIQMEHQCMVSGVERVLFMASLWEQDRDTGAWKCSEEYHCWYEPDLALRERIVTGWAVFEEDVARYTPPAAEPVVHAKAPETLPALRIEVVGTVTSSNLGEFKAHALRVIRSVNRDLQTDEDFANADLAVKWAAEVKEKLDAAKQHALSQTETIDLLFRTIDEITGEADRVRIELQNLIKARKEARREEIVAAGRKDYADYLRSVDDMLGETVMQSRTSPAAVPDFAGAIKGKRSFALMRDAVQALVAKHKVEAADIGNRMQANFAALKAHTDARPELAGLFPDRLTIALKQPDDLAAIITARTAQYDEKVRAQQEADRERIRAEEEARARRTQEAVDTERRLLQTTEPAAAPAPAAPAEVAPPAPARWVSAPRLESVASAAPAANEPPPADAVPTLRIGAIAERLGWTMTAEQLRALGIEPAGKERGAVLFHEQQFPAICDAIARRAMEAKAAHVQRLAA